jgi:hypothetical protein
MKIQVVKMFPINGEKLYYKKGAPVHAELKRINKEVI